MGLRKIKTRLDKLNHDMWLSEIEETFLKKFRANIFETEKKLHQRQTDVTEIGFNKDLHFEQTQKM